MRKRFFAIWAWIKKKFPTWVETAIESVIPLLIKIGISSLAKAPKKAKEDQKSRP